MKILESYDDMARRIRVARGKEPADILFVNGKVISTFTDEVLETSVAVCGDRIAALGGDGREARETVDLCGAYLSPSFIDAHIHVESSMLTPEGFAEAVVPRGTGATVSDPHEIVNVMGMKGFAFMREASKNLPMEIFYTIPSCVPATNMEHSGAVVGPEEVAEAFDLWPDTPGLSEMMNFPGVLFTVPEVLAKVRAAKERGYMVDGHSPGLTGKDLDGYLSAGILTDHECLTADEAREKLRRGMWVLLREGSAAKNLVDLLPAVDPGSLHRVCIASDDRHPDDLVHEGHMDHSLRVAVGAGLDPIKAIRMVTLNPATLYGLRDRGGIAPGLRADFAVFDNLHDFKVRVVYHGGRKVAEGGRILESLPRHLDPATHSSVHLPSDLSEKLKGYPSEGKVRVIGVVPGQLVTRNETGEAAEVGSGKRLQYAAVVERHHRTGCVGLGYAEGFTLNGGALASTVSHDSHNLVLVGTTPEEMAHAAEVVAEMGGGQAVVCGGEVLAKIPLAVAGLMSEGKPHEVAKALEKANAAAGSLGCTIHAPFMTLSFIALPVIPSLKLTDEGLVDVDAFKPVPLLID